MADIIKNDVRTYVRELIANEFVTNTNSDKVLSDDHETIANGYRNERFQPLYNQPFKKE